MGTTTCWFSIFSRATTAPNLRFWGSLKIMTAHERLWLGGLASGGVVLAHWIAFFLAAPAPAPRHELLRQTGHGAWAYVVALAVGLLVACLAGGLCGRLRGEPSRVRSLAYSWVRLLAYQAVLFIVLEGLERIASSGTPLSLAIEPVVIVGLLVQVVVAAIGALALVGLDRAATVLFRRLGARRRASTSARGRSLDRGAVFTSRPVLGSITSRAPPLHPA